MSTCELLEADLLHALALSREEKDALGAYGREVIGEYYSVRRMASDCVSVYKQVWRRKSVVLSGYYGFRNLGDDAILDAIARQVRSMSDPPRLTVLSNAPQETKNEYGVDAEYEARVVGYDEDADLAVLKVEAEGLPAAAFGVSDDLQVGDPVYAIGNPLGVELRNTLTDGIVSAINRDVDVDGVKMTLIQTTAALNSGNSGGPLINQYGQVIGINTIKMMSEYDTIEGLGFAIPSSLALRWVNELIEFGKIQPQPVLGVTINRIPEAMPDGRSGLLIDDVTPGLSADRAGILPGDYLTAFCGQDIVSYQQLLNLRRDLRVGDVVPVQVWRDGAYEEFTMLMMAE
jgi:S1-C subfamily serine protease